MTPTVDDLLRILGALAVLAVLGAAALLVWRVRAHRDLGTEAERATFETLHTASLAAPPLRDGLSATGAGRSVPHLRALLGTAAVALVDPHTTLAWDGEGGHHAPAAVRHAASVLAGGRTKVLDVRRMRSAQLEEQGWACDELDCAIRSAVVAPVVDGRTVVGALIAYGPTASAGLVRAVEEVAGWVSAQVELAELDRSRTRAMEAELRALRAQISPHFIYNSLAAIASFVRTEPDRARELLLEFADFTRYAFRRGGEFTTLADELSNVQRYLVLEQARFGEQLVVRLQVAPEVLPVAVPFLAIQPLVENAVRHGLRRKPGVGHVTLGAEDAGAEAVIWVDDDGVGADPEVIRALLAGTAEPEATPPTEPESVGLSNVDARLRQVFGPDHGLVVETAPGAGMRVSFRVPKFAPGVDAHPHRAPGAGADHHAP